MPGSGDNDIFMKYFLGIDVGTGSARVGLFDDKGKLISHAVRDIEVWKPKHHFVEQSSDNIWNCICRCTKEVIETAQINSDKIKGIGFDATCSLVLIDKNGNPVSVDSDGDNNKNIIVWMDHRALAETEQINSFNNKYDVFKYVGGKISPEMQLPKLLWLKKNLPETWSKTSHFFDLPDFLTYKATGSFVRSLCSLTCKWTYSQQEKWNQDFLKEIGLEDLIQDNFSKIGNQVLPMGQNIGQGLSETAAKEMGLCAGIAVGVSIIDAHAGGIGMIGLANDDDEVDFDKRLALIGGTSSCHMAVSPTSRFITGIWGPYYSAMVPDLWLNEGGQSATGSLIDHVVFNHGAYLKAKKNADKESISIYEYLNDFLIRELSNHQILDFITKEFHVCPYFHGNRSPRANPELVGMISGLNLSSEIRDLAILYLATIQAIAYGTRHIIDAMNNQGYNIDTIICCGGGTKNPIFLQQHANITSCRLILPKEPEAVLLGSAMLGAVASKSFTDLKEAMSSMSAKGKTINPEIETKEYHSKKYQVFHKLYEDQIKYKNIMN